MKLSSNVAQPNKIKLAVVLAAGRGRRFSRQLEREAGPEDLEASLPKQYQRLGGEALLTRSLRPFLRAKTIEAVYVVISEEDRALFEKVVLSDLSPSEINQISLVYGAQDRARSLEQALLAIERDYQDLLDQIAILSHDAARPFVSDALISAHLEALDHELVVATALESSDTLFKSVDGKYVGPRLKREEIFRAQTPQSFDLQRYLEAYRRLSESEIDGLSDAISVFEQEDLKIRFVPGDPLNIKVTSASDWQIAQAILASL
ncbi:MAG: IspD/TarI family cytidylyltransferase [Eubacteriales bacterium]|nr:IspD/TarI family cytidylyltransferase [Eubacteriales bacterium]